MSGNSTHVKLNGVKYMLAEDAEGQHFQVSGEPLRPPNGVQVQGENNQFQVRPDRLLWTLTDWSGGEGQIKFDPQNPNRWRALEAVRAFDRPGTLTPGWYAAIMEDSLGVLDEDGPIVSANHVLYLFNDASPTFRTFDAGTEKWSAATTLTGPVAGVSNQLASDGTAIYWHEKGTDNVWKWSLSGTVATQIDSGGMANSSDALVAQLGAYVYVYLPSEGEVWEISKAGGSEVLIDDFSSEPSAEIDGDLGIMAMDGKIYVLLHVEAGATVREITPTTAAGTGFGAEIARFSGLDPSAMWAHSGTLYITGRFGDPNNAVVLYVNPSGEYGSLGKVRLENFSGFGGAGSQNGDMLSHFFVYSDGITMRVYQVDAITGGMAVVATLTGGSWFPGQSVLFEDDGFFWPSEYAAGDERTFRADPDQYSLDSYAISPWHDFNLADEKILNSIVLSTEALPADWDVIVSYALDGLDSWNTAITYSTDGGKGTKADISTASSTVKFRTLSIKIAMEYTGAGVPTEAPSVLGVDASAMVAKPQRVWRLLLDCSDKRGAQAPESGIKKMTNIKTAAHLEQVVEFVDMYSDRVDSEAFNVVIDEYMITVSTQGEGYAQVVLKEVS